MAGTIWEFFAYRTDDLSKSQDVAAKSEICPILNDKCQKSFNDGVIAGVCAIKPMTSEPVICCPVRLYADNYKILKDVAGRAFGSELELVRGDVAIEWAKGAHKGCVAVFGKGWGGELRLPQKSTKGGYFIDWILAHIDSSGELVEFTAVEVQTIDTTGTYRPGFDALKSSREVIKTTAGLNWENVAKRILPQLIYKGQILQREELCRSGLFFVCPEPVYKRIMDRLSGQGGLIRYALQPASITFSVYDYDFDNLEDSKIVPLRNTQNHSTTVYKLQEAFNNVTLPDENVCRDAILRALGV